MRLPLVAAAALVVVLAIAAAAACLPDLAPIVTADASFVETGPITRFLGCGDGIIATLDDGGDAGESCDPGADGGVPGCSADCRIECAGGTIDPTSGHCYFVAGVDTTFNNASTRCAAAAVRGHVVTFASQREVDFVSQHVTPGAPTYWVGLARSVVQNAYVSDHVEEPGFPIPGPPPGTPGAGPCSGCFGVGADGAGVFPSEVDGGSNDCVASSNGGWLKVPCGPADAGAMASRTTICEREPVGVRAGDCIGGFCFTLASTSGKKRYLVAVAMTDPDTAAQTCSSFDGGSLVVLESREEREQLAHEIRAHYASDESNPNPPHWIGLVEDGGTWTWDDGRVASDDAGRPLPWGNAQPPAAPAAGARAYINVGTTTTAAYDTQLSYGDDASKTPRFYICQRPATE